MALHSPTFSKIDKRVGRARPAQLAVQRARPKSPAPICMFMYPLALRNSTTVLRPKTRENGPICVLLGIQVGTYLGAQKNPSRGAWRGTKTHWRRWVGRLRAFREGLVNASQLLVEIRVTIKP